MKRLIIIYLLLLNLAYSCTNKGNTTDNPAKLLGQKLTLPKDIATRYIGDKDTVVRSSNIKLVTYYTESDCTSCSLKQLSNWQYYLDEIKRTNIDVDFIVIIDSKHYKDEVKKAIAKQNFTNPIFDDDNNTFRKSNILPDDVLYHTFLLNKNNQILAIGTPIYSTSLWNKYKTTINRLDSLYKN